MSDIKIPYYYQSIDWSKLVKKYPPPLEFESTVYRWTRDKIEKMQAERFMEAVRFAWDNPFYKKLWTEAGVVPGDIKSIKDIHKLPVVSSLDFKSAIDEDPPWGAHQGITPSVIGAKPLKIQTSGGTTGMPRPTLFGPLEWEIMGLSTARALLIQGGRPGDIMQIPMTCYTATAAWHYYYACHAWSGIVPLTTGAGSVTPSIRQIEFAREYGTNIWLGGPYHLQLANIAAEKMDFDVRDLGTKFLHSFLGVDKSGRLRSELEDVWGCDGYDNYGTHEISLASFECKEKAGMHFQEDLGYVEILDPVTLEPVSMEDGEEGDLVYTSFYRQHPPLIRYNLKDRVGIMDYGKQCGCGSYLLRRNSHSGRSDDMVKIKGTNVYPEALQDTINRDSRTTGEYLCVLNTADDDGLNFPSEEMIVKVEYKDISIDLDDFKNELEVRLKESLGVRISVEPVPSDSLINLTSVDGVGGLKKRRLLDNRSP